MKKLCVILICIVLKHFKDITAAELEVSEETISPDDLPDFIITFGYSEVEIKSPFKHLRNITNVNLFKIINQSIHQSINQ